jgi:hypothetical protein
MSIGFQNKLLNKSTGMGKLKAFIRRRVLNMPIQNFKAKKGFDQDPKTFYMTEMELDVYPLIKKIEQTEKPIPYRCQLSPLPLIGKESDITFEEYEQICNNYKETKSFL